MYRVNSTGTNEYYSRDEIIDTVRWADDESAATIITTEDNGYPAIGFTHLNGGTYYLEEVSAPAGYVPLSNVVTVTIDLNNTDKAVATVPNGDNTVAKTLDIETALDENSNVYTFTVTVKKTGTAEPGIHTFYYDLADAEHRLIPLPESQLSLLQQCL